MTLIKAKGSQRQTGGRMLEMDVHRFKSSNQGSTCSQTVTMADTAGSSDMGEKKITHGAKCIGEGLRYVRTTMLLPTIT